MNKKIFLSLLNTNNKRLSLILSACCLLFIACGRDNTASELNLKSKQSEQSNIPEISNASSNQTLTKIIDALVPLNSYRVTISFLDSNALVSQLIKANGKRIAEINYDQPSVKRSIHFYATADGDGQIKIEFEKLCIGEKRFYTDIEVVKENPPSDSIKTNIIILGDSITEGYPFFDISYPKLLAQKLNANSYKFSAIEIYDKSNRVNIYNLGIQCERLKAISARFEDVQNRMLANAENIFILFGGSNNIGDDSAEEIESQIRQICDKAKAVHFNRIYIVTITPRSDATPKAEETRNRLNDNLRANYTKYADGIIDLAALKPFQDRNDEMFSNDTVKVHFSPVGDEIAASKIFELLKSRLKSNERK